MQRNKQKILKEKSEGGNDRFITQSLRMNEATKKAQAQHARKRSCRSSSDELYTLSKTSLFMHGNSNGNFFARKKNHELALLKYLFYKISIDSQFVSFELNTKCNERFW